MGFNAANYDVLSLSVPTHGMNQAVSPEVLPTSYAYFLENIIPRPKGSGCVRYGTKKVFSLESPTANIIGTFAFSNKNEQLQHVIYYTDFVVDNTAHTFVIYDSKTEFSFITNTPDRYINALRLKILYTFKGENRIIDHAEKVRLDTVNPNKVIITLHSSAFPQDVSGSDVISISHDKGSIGFFHEDSGFTVLRDNLSAVCIPRGVNIAGLLLLCNGIDPVLQWDGTTLSIVKQFVRQKDIENLQRIGDVCFSFRHTGVFKEEHYQTGSLLRLIIDGTNYELTVESYSDVGGICTVTTREVLPSFEGSDLTLDYSLVPPAFSYMFTMYNRVWALGPGATSLQFRAPEEALKVYYSYSAGLGVIEFFNHKTGILPNLNLQETHGVFDNLEAISTVSGHMAFIGRNSTQLWQGTTPISGVELDPDETNVSSVGTMLRYQTTIPVGVVHPELLHRIGNDLYMITKRGLVSLGFIRDQTLQFAGISHDVMDPLMLEHLKMITSSQLAYLSTRAFKYNGGPLAGFKIGNNNVLCSLFETNLDAWTTFSGDFKKAMAFSSVSNALFLSRGNGLYKYADGRDGSLPSYGDKNGQELIFFTWALPVLKFKERTYANLFYDILLKYPSSFVVRKENSIIVSIAGDLPLEYGVESAYRFSNVGDAFSTVPLNTKDPSETTASDIGFRMRQNTRRFRERLKFVASRFWVIVKGYTKDGTVSLDGLNLYGTLERKT